MLVNLCDLKIFEKYHNYLDSSSMRFSIIRMIFGKNKYTIFNYFFAIFLKLFNFTTNFAIFRKISYELSSTNHMIHRNANWAISCILKSHDRFEVHHG